MNNLIQWPRAVYWDNCYARCATVDRTLAATVKGLTLQPEETHGED